MRGARRADADQPRADAVDRRGAQRLAGDRALEDQEEQSRSARRADATISITCPLTVKPSPQRRSAPSASGWCAKPSGPKNSRPRPDSRKCSASETISSTSTDASAIGWNDDAREQRRDRHHEQHRRPTICTACRHAAARRRPGERAGHAAAARPQSSDARGMRARLAAAHAGRTTSVSDGQQRRASATRPIVGGMRPVSKRGERQRREGGDVAERHEDHARHREDQHQRRGRPAGRPPRWRGRRCARMQRRRPSVMCDLLR